jgi:hypothetical protein
MLESLWYRANDSRANLLGRCGHLMSDKTRRNHWLPRVPGNRQTRAAIHPVATWSSDSTKRTHINVMITLTPDKLAWWGWDSSQEIRYARDPDGQHQNGSLFPGVLHLQKRWSKTTPTSIVRWDGTTSVSRHCSHVCQLQYVGRCRGQHSPSTSPPPPPPREKAW